MTLSKLKNVLYDARFIRICEILISHNKILAIYLIRLITSKGLSFSKKYLDRLDEFKNKARNPLQY